MDESIIRLDEVEPAPRPSAPRPWADWVMVGCWLLAAGLYVAASKTTVVHVRQKFNAVTMTTSWNAWGTFTAQHSAGIEVDPYQGPKYGLLFVCCAVLLAVSVFIGFGRGLAHKVGAHALSTLAAAAGAGVAATQYIVGQSYGAAGGSRSQITYGPSLWFAVAAAVIGLVPAAVRLGAISRRDR